MLSNGSIEIIPNPNNGQFVLEMNGLMGETVIEVINSSGALVQKIETNMLSKKKSIVLTLKFNWVFIWSILSKTGQYGSDYD